MRAITVLVWALAAASVLYWGLRLSSSRGITLAPAQTVAATTVNPLAVARILGATAPTEAQAAAPISLSSRFALQGVVAGSPGGGAALISVDGKPARPYRVGSSVEEGLILRSANARQATLAATPGGPALVTLEMPVLK